MLIRISVLLILVLAITVVSSSIRTGPQVTARPTRRCVSEYAARLEAPNVVLPDYPEEAKKEGPQGLVSVVVLFDQEGKVAKTKFLETPHSLLKEAVSHALEQWKLLPMYDSRLEKEETQTQLRFHFIFENGQGRVEPATEEEQREFGGARGRRACDRSAFDK